MIAEHSRVLVTGASGLIGAAVVRLLRERGNIVVACDDFSLGMSRLEEDGIVWEQVDVSEAGFSDRFSKYEPSAVIHCAAHPGGLSLEAPATNVRVNALGSMQVFEWCAKQKIPVIYLSSSAVYGEQPPGPIPETAALRPSTIYAVCKVTCESFLRVLEAGYGLPWTVLRLFATYGAGHRPNAYQGIVNVVLTQLLAGNALTVKGSLDRVRDLLYVEDAARAIVGCLSNPNARGHVFNVGTGVGVTVRELIATLCEVLGRRVSDVTITEAAATVGDPLSSVADATALEAAIGFVPRFALRDGLVSLVQARLAGSRP